MQDFDLHLSIQLLYLHFYFKDASKFFTTAAEF